MNMKLISRLNPKLLSIVFVCLALGILVVVGSRRSQAQYAPAPILPVEGVYGEADVSAPSLNLRTGPHVSYTAVAYLMEGEEVQLIGRNRTGTWVQIELYNGYRGWVNASYIRPTVDIAALPIADVSLLGITAFVTNDPIPVYTGSDAGYALVDWARPGDVLALNGRNDTATWVHVYLPDGRAGWVAANSSFLPSASLNDLPILTPFMDAPSPNLAAFFLVYTGPGFLYEPVDSVDQGQTLGILGRTADNRWVQVRLPNGREGWIAAEIIHLSTELASVPVVHGIAAPQVVGWQTAGSGPSATQATSGGKQGGTGPTATPAATETATPAATATDIPPTATTEATTAAPTAIATATGTTTAAAPTATGTVVPTTTATAPPPSPTATPEATGTSEAELTPPPGLPIVYVYATPDDTTVPILRVVPGQSVVLVGRSADAEWIKIWLPGGQEGWVRAELLQLDIDISVLPIVEP